MRGQDITGIKRLSGQFVSGNAILVCAAIAFAGCTPMTGGSGNDNVNDNTGNTNENAAPRCIPDETSGTSSVSYNQDLVPLLARHDCLTSACHGGTFLSGGYDLRTYEGLFGPGDVAEIFGICNVVPGDPDASFLIEKLLANPRSGTRMPQNRPALSDEEIDMIRTWIADGAPDN
jgi:hypothetical protein